MNRKNSDNSQDEVDQLLQAAQDEMLLKLSLDSHISHLSSNYLDSDLDRRFHALKSRPSIPPPPPPSSSSSSKPKSPLHRDSKPVSDDDLFARFSALKATSSISSSPASNDNNPKTSDHDDDNDSEDEVDKVIRWAMDAARLDPSPPSDDDDDDDDDDEGAVAKEKRQHK